MRKTKSPKSLWNSTPYGFSQVAYAESGQCVFISGQVAWDKDQSIVGRNDIALQARKCLENLENAINSVGGNLDNIMMLRIYIVSYKPEHGKIISSLLNKFFGEENQPASTWINVQGLASDDFLIEIEAQAIIRESI
ncbi:RidA family protein [Portibacter marinus]|uniref:RidA family protein n=1 Tax=Portibacter marinus TaxID=2898660 RepID=UPI001F3EA59A|nr:RidA family protein [Portibacter marinus]